MASHESTSTSGSYDDREVDETRTVSDLVPLTVDEFEDAITEIKPVVTGTIRFPKEHSSMLSDAVTDALTATAWVRDVTAVTAEETTIEGDELRVSGEFTLTVHFTADEVDATADEALQAVTAATSDSTHFIGVTDISLRMPPYRLRAY